MWHGGIVFPNLFEVKEHLLIKFNINSSLLMKNPTFNLIFHFLGEHLLKLVAPRAVVSHISYN